MKWIVAVDRWRRVPYLPRFSNWPQFGREAGETMAGGEIVGRRTIYLFCELEG